MIPPNGIQDPAIADLLGWCCRSVTTAPKGTPGYRDLYFNQDESGYTWRHPWSNSAERIEVFLWARGHFGHSVSEECARRYADAMLTGDSKGILLRRGRPADGMVAYWSEVDAYMTNYTMRVPPAFLAAARYFGASRFEQAAYRSAHALVRFQNDDGILRCGFSASGHASVTPNSINSRCFYAAYPFATMLAHDGNPIWKEALEKLVSAIESQQRDDGSFPAQIPAARDGAYCDHKGHFHAYILYGLARASLILPDWTPLFEAARKLARFCVGQIARHGTHVYGSHVSQGEQERHVWKSAVPDLGAGLAWLAIADKNRAYADAARSLIERAFENQARNPDCEDSFGAIPTIVKLSNGVERQEYGGFYAFWTLLAVMGLQHYDASLATNLGNDSTPVFLNS